MFAIYSVIPNDEAHHVSRKTTAEACDVIKEHHQGHNRVKEAHLQSLLWDYESLKMQESEIVDVFTTRVVEIIGGIKDLGENLTEISIVHHFLRAVAPRYMQLITSIEQCMDLKTLSVAELVERFKARDESIWMNFGDMKEG